MFEFEYAGFIVCNLFTSYIYLCFESVKMGARFRTSTDHASYAFGAEHLSPENKKLIAAASVRSEHLSSSVPF